MPPDIYVSHKSTILNNIYDHWRVNKDFWLSINNPLEAIYFKDYVTLWK